jgi:Holliday junction resolvasome RuvABC endonuclease subunit
MTLEDLAFAAIARSTPHIDDPVELVDKQPDFDRFGCTEVDAPSVNVCILALDLGTKTGYACRRRDGRVIHGTESFAPRKSWSPGQRAIRFRSWLVEVLNTNQVNKIAYEAVHRHIGTDAAHMYGLFEGLVWMAADSRCIPVDSVGVGSIKKTWTGWGDAAKEGMIAEARRRGYRPDTDNAADALAILDWALMQESDGNIRLGDGSMPEPAAVLRRPRKSKEK